MDPLKPPSVRTISVMTRYDKYSLSFLENFRGFAGEGVSHEKHSACRTLGFWSVLGL